MLKKIILTLFSFFLTQSSLADLRDYQGCYLTRLIDGRPPTLSSDPYRNLSTVTIAESSVFTDLDQAPLEHFLVTLYTGGDGNWAYYHPFVAFLGLGQWSIREDSLTYNIDEDILLWSYQRSSVVDHQLAFKMEIISSSLISGTFVFRSESRNMTGERSFLIEKTDCQY
jgi:hypothetical protein